MTVGHKRLQEDPEPLSIVNPVYEDDSIELQDKATKGSANNNLNKSLVDKQQELAGDDVVVDVEKQTRVGSVTQAKAGSSSNGHAHDPSDSDGSKGTEKLLDGVRFSERCSKKLMIIIVATVLILLAAIVGAYFIYVSLHGSSLSTEESSAAQITESEVTKYFMSLDGEANDGIISLQAFYHDEWKGVCSTGWNDKAALVLCRQFMSSAIISASILENAGNIDNRNSSVVSTVYHPVTCNGSELSITQCQVQTKLEICEKTSHRLTISCHFPETSEKRKVNIRLVGSVKANVGRLEVEQDSEWGTVCDDDWDKEDAYVVCRQLGYSNYSEYIITHSAQRVEAPLPNQPVFMNNMNCSGNESNLGECHYVSSITSSIKCSTFENVVLSCLLADVSSTSLSSQASTTNLVSSSTSSATISTTQSTTTSTTQPTTTTALPLSQQVNISIEYGLSPEQGMLILSDDGRQYAVCNEDWSDQSALVACRTLGFHEVVKRTDPHLNLIGGRNPGQIAGENGITVFPSTITCMGNESSLADCQFHSLTATCFTSFSVLIVCGPPPTTTSLGTSTTTAATTPTTTASSMVTTTATVSSTTTAHVSITTETVTPAVTEDPRRPIKEKAPVRLVNSREDNGVVGRLEVFINGTWGTVCDDRWSRVNAYVVCKQLGYSEIDEYKRLTERDGVSRGSDDQEIWLKNIECDGSEEYLTMCTHELNNGHCNHMEDIMMSCERNATEFHSNGDIRLNPGPDRGRLEYYHNGQWGAVCDKGWDETDASVACRQLGYKNVTAHELGKEGFQLSDDIPWLVSELHCSGNESAIKNCTQAPVGQNECSEPSWWYGTGNSRIYLACDPYSKVVTTAAPLQTTTDPKERIRLINGLEDENIGILQYRVDGQWGALCDEGWTQTNAETACRLLGFPGVLMYKLNISQVRNVSIAALSVPFHGTSYACHGNEEEMKSCPHLRLLSSSSSCIPKVNDVAIACTPRPEQLAINASADATVRLVDGESKYEGRVEVMINGSWGRVCGDEWTHNNMKDVCFKLFRKQHFATDLDRIDVPTVTNSPFIAGRFNCTTTANDTISTMQFNQCDYSTNPEYLNSCTQDAQ